MANIKSIGINPHIEIDFKFEYKGYEKTVDGKNNYSTMIIHDEDINFSKWLDETDNEETLIYIEDFNNEITMHEIIGNFDDVNKETKYVSFE